MSKLLVIFPEKCTGCGLCELACSYKHKGEFSVSLSRIKVKRNESRGFFNPITCTQCEYAPCAKVCPTSALTRNARTGVVEWYKDECIGCELCIPACPIGAITFMYGELIKCDLCGGDPECVKICPTDALKFMDRLEIGKDKRDSILHKNMQTFREIGG